MGYYKYTSNTLSILCLNVGLALSSISGAAAQETSRSEPLSENPASAPKICASKSSLYAPSAELCKIYQPRFPLWSDGSAKERYIFLPPGGAINFSDKDRWSFPVGTRLYKNFMEADGSDLLETRVITKVRPGDGIENWNFKSYRWTSNATDPQLVLNVTQGGGPNIDTSAKHKNIGALQHDIPSMKDCVQCHAMAPLDEDDNPIPKDPVLGFQAIQLNGTTDLLGKRMEYQLSAVPGVSEDIKNGASIVSDDPKAVDAIGYLHGNCGNCHAPGGYADAMTDLYLRAEVGASVQPVMNAIGDCRPDGRQVKRLTGEDDDGHPQNLTVKARIEPGHPELSFVYARMSTRGGMRMPLIASKQRDELGMRLVRDWIDSLSPTQHKTCVKPATTPVGNEPFEEQPIGEEPFEEEEPIGEEPVGEEPFEEEGEEPFEEEEGEEPFESDPFGFAGRGGSAHSH